MRPAFAMAFTLLICTMALLLTTDALECYKCEKNCQEKDAVTEKVICQSPKDNSCGKIYLKAKSDQKITLIKFGCSSVVPATNLEDGGHKVDESCTSVGQYVYETCKYYCNTDLCNCVGGEPCNKSPKDENPHNDAANVSSLKQYILASSMVSLAYWAQYC